MGDILEFTHATAPLKDCRMTCGISFARNMASRPEWCRS
jgi:hypothetical protein